MNISYRWRAYFALVATYWVFIERTAIASLLMFPLALKLLKELWLEGRWERKEYRRLFKNAANGGSDQGGVDARDQQGDED
ncbi:MAG: hypothetical protein OXU64_07605 [Gemmatimonadota bacterium]|nr:hypothetical protein [Gemmatimonadota bacterium]